MYLKVKHLLTLFIFFSTTINAQNLKSIYKNIVKEDYNDVQAEYNKSNNEFNKEEKILFELSKCIIYSKSKYQSFKPREAYIIYKSLSIINLTQNEEININEFLSKYTYSISGIYDTIIKGVFLESKILNTIVSYEEAIQICNDCKYKIELLNLKEVTAYKQALNYGNVEVLEQFLINYPTSKSKDEIEDLLHIKAYERATLLNTIISLNEYILKYFNSKLISNAFRYRDSLVLKSTNKTYKDYFAFIIKYPNSIFNSSISKQLPDLLYNEIKVDNDYYKMLEFIKNFPNDFRVNEIKTKFDIIKFYEVSVNKINNLPINSNYGNDFRYNYRNHLIHFGNGNYVDTCGVLKFDKIVSGEYYGNKFDLASKNGKWGIIDSIGRDRTLFMYDELNFSQGFIEAKINDKWGVIDINGKEIIPIKYNEIKLFKDGYAIVKIIDEIIKLDTNQSQNIKLQNNIKWGIIDTLDRVIFPFTNREIDLQRYRYSLMVDYFFNRGKAIFYINKKCGMITKAAKEIISFKHDYISYHEKYGIAEVTLNEKVFITDSIGSIICKEKPKNTQILSSKLLSIELNKKYGIIDFYGKEILPINYDKIRVLNSNLISFKKDNKYGLINSYGRIICPLKYESISEFDINRKYSSINKFDKNRATVGINLKYSGEGYNSGEYAIIDEFGTQLTEFKYSEISSFENGFANVRDLKGNHGIIDINGKEVVPFDKYDVVHLYGGESGVVKKNGKYALIDSLGKILTQIKYNYIDGGEGNEYNSDFRKVTINNKYGLINQKGKELTDIKYDEIDAYGYAKYAKFKYNGKSGFLDTNGKELFLNKYDKLYRIDNIIIAELNGKNGVLDISGKVLTPFKYDEIYKIKGDIIIAKLKGKMGILDISGKELTPFKYDEIYKIKGGIIIAELNGKNGVLDISGKELTPFKYDEIYKIKGDIIIAKLNGKLGFLDLNGKELTPFKYDEIYKIKGDIIIAKLNGKLGFLDLNGKELTPFQYEAFDEIDGKFIITKLNGKNGVIDLFGKEVAPFKYAEIQYIINDIFIADENGEIKIFKIIND